MKRRTAILALIVLGIGGLLLTAVLSGWPLVRFQGGIVLPENVRAQIGETELSDSQTDELRTLLGRLPTMKKAIFTRPEFEIVLSMEGEETMFYSVWLAEGYIYDGHFLDAWSERMAHDSANVFRIDKETDAFMTTLISGRLAH